MYTSDPTTDRSLGTALIVSVAVLALLLSRVDGPWWVKALGALVMVGLTFVGFRLGFYRRDGKESAGEPGTDDPDPPP